MACVAASPSALIVARAASTWSVNWPANSSTALFVLASRAS